MYWSKPLTAAVALFLAGAVPSAAEAQFAGAEARTACRSDYEQFCSGVMPGGGRIVACLNGHLDELRPACAEAVSLGMKCVEDLRKFCGDAAPGDGEVRACLLRNRQQLTASCAGVVAKFAGN